MGFCVDGSRFVFADGDILAIKDGKIVEKRSVLEFNKRPSQIFRILQYAIEMETGLENS